MDPSKIKGAKLCKYKNGDTIVKQGDSTEYVYYLIDGLCCRSICRENGVERIFGVRKANDGVASFLGLLVLTYNRDFYTCSFHALSDCQCYRIPNSSFRELMDTDMDFLRQIIAFSSNEYNKLVNEVIAHSENSIANYLCQLIYELTKPNAQGKKCLSNKYTMEILSKMSGVTTVTVARIISFLKTKGVVSREKSALVIEDEAEFLNYCNGKKIKYGK